MNKFCQGDSSKKKTPCIDKSPLGELRTNESDAGVSDTLWSVCDAADITSSMTSAKRKAES